MKSKFVFFVFICVQLFFVFFYIHDQSQRIQLSYQKQKYEKRKTELLAKKQTLQQTLHATHNLAAIKAYAVQAKLQKVKLNQIKTLDYECTV